MKSETPPARTNLDPNLFWQRFESLNDASRWTEFYSYANFMVDACEAGLVTRRQLGIALSPAWNMTPLKESPDINAASDLAADFKSGALESDEESQWTFDELAEIIRKYR